MTAAEYKFWRAQCNKFSDVLSVTNWPQTMDSVPNSILVIADDAFFYYVGVFSNIRALAKSEINYVFFPIYKIVFMQICGKFYMKEQGHTCTIHILG